MTIRQRLDDLICEGDPADVVFARRLIESFLSRAPGLLKQVAVAVAATDPDAAAYSAHALKGAAANIGADALAALSAEVESHAEAGRLHLVEGHPARIEAELARAGEDLREVIRSM